MNKIFLGDKCILVDELTITDYNQKLYFPKIPKKGKFSIGRGKNSYSILPLFCGFDIETTNIAEVKASFMYIASVAIASEYEGYIYHFRKWEFFIYFLDELSKHYDLSEKQRIDILIANFGFEFQFVRKRLKWKEDLFFAKEHRKPLIAVTDNYIEFREVLSITGGGLAYLAEKYTTTQKMVGDLDYNIIRNSHSKIKEEEMHYINNDVIILAEFSYYIAFEYLKKDHKFPMTKTGILRNELKHLIKERTDFDLYCKLIAKMQPQSEEEYNNLFNYLFRGGYVHANIYWTDLEISLNNTNCFVVSYDETSAYPAMMILKDNYPITPFEFTLMPLDYCLKNYACIIDITFYNIERSTNHSIESVSKAIKISDDYKVDNGRIAKASELRVWLTEQDYFNYLDFYKWENAKIHSLRIAKRGKLPDPWLELLKRDYKYKNYLKTHGMKDSKDYEIYKQRINSYYGMSVTKEHFIQWNYLNDEEWITQISDKQKETLPFLSCFWGFWICANQRRTLLSLCKKLENAERNSVIYNDTDSIKARFSDTVVSVINEFNDSVQNRKIEIGLLDPDFETLGLFELEEKYKRFKTEGAKRYLVETEKGEIIATIAGFPKTAVKNFKDPFEDFDYMGFEFDPIESEKKTAFYNDEIVSYNVDGEIMTELSSVYIFKIPFKLKLTDEYIISIQEMKNERKRIDYEFTD